MEIMLCGNPTAWYTRTSGGHPCHWTANSGPASVASPLTQQGLSGSVSYTGRSLTLVTFMAAMKMAVWGRAFLTHWVLSTKSTSCLYISSQACLTDRPASGNSRDGSLPLEWPASGNRRDGSLPLDCPDYHDYFYWSSKATWIVLPDLHHATVMRKISQRLWFLFSRALGDREIIARLRVSDCSGGTVWWFPYILCTHSSIMDRYWLDQGSHSACYYFSTCCGITSYMRPSWTFPLYHDMNILWTFRGTCDVTSWSSRSTTYMDITIISILLMDTNHILSILRHIIIIIDTVPHVRLNLVCQGLIWQGGICNNVHALTLIMNMN